jgi:hypothetical protein
MTADSATNGVALMGRMCLPENASTATNRISTPALKGITKKHTRLLALLEELDLGHVLLQALHVHAQGLLGLVDAAVINSDADLAGVLGVDLGGLFCFDCVSIHGLDIPSSKLHAFNSWREKPRPIFSFWL